MNINISRNEILNEVERRISVESSIMPEKYDLLWVNTNKKELLKGYWIEGCESVVSLFKRYLDTETISHTLTSGSTDETFVIDVTMPGRYNSLLDGSVSTDVKMMMACNITYRWFSVVLPDVSEKYNVEANGYADSIQSKICFRTDPVATLSSSKSDDKEIGGDEAALSQAKGDSLQIGGDETELSQAKNDSDNIYLEESPLSKPKVDEVDIVQLRNCSCKANIR